MNSIYTPSRIVQELSRHIVGQEQAKKAVAIAVRNRWRRLQIDEPLRSEIIPRNILMIGPTGVGKTEIARRLSKLVNAPFLKVEATKFTEVGYVGRDVEQIIRDLIEVGVRIVKDISKKSIEETAQHNVINMIVDILVGESALPETREKFKKKLENQELDSKDIDIEINDTPSPAPSIDIPGMPGAQMGMFNLSDLFQKTFASKKKTIKTTIGEAKKLLLQDQIDELLDMDAVHQNAIDLVQNHGIVFIDEIDKICTRQQHKGSDVSREGVQRDLLPLIEGTSVPTKYGVIKTEHILFIASGAFHISKPSDLLPELQGRLPIRVELQPLSQSDFVKILTEPEHNLLTQAIGLLKTEGVVVSFDSEAIDHIARLATVANSRIENIGARRLHTIIEKLLEDISFNAPDLIDKSIVITKDMVIDIIEPIVKKQDLSQFIL